MFKLVVAVLALAVFGANGRPYGEENDIFECNGKPNGYYPDATNAGAFFSCDQGRLLAKVVCEDGFVYDGDESCIPVVAEVAKEDTENDMVKEEEQDGEFNLPQLFPPKYDDDDDDDDDNDNDNDNDQIRGISKKKVFNIEITKNIFPASIIIIGKANREQKNK